MTGSFRSRTLVEGEGAQPVPSLHFSPGQGYWLGVNSGKALQRASFSACVCKMESG